MAGKPDRWNTGCAFIDYERDEKLDLFVATYVDLGVNFVNVPAPGSGQFYEYKGIPIACESRGLKPAVNYLFRNNSNGTFTDVSEAAGIRKADGHYALGVLTLDYDNDGWPDIYVACDSTASILYRKTIMTAHSPITDSRRAQPSTTMASRRREWASLRLITITTASWIS